MKKDKLQTDVFEWDGDDEERFAMDKVHGLNDFDDNELQGKFNTMDEVNGDDDWRALASQAQTEVEQNAAALSHIAGVQQAEPAVLAQAANLSSPPAAPAAAPQAQAQPVLMGEMQLVDDSGSPTGIRIMRFTRKKTTFQRGRRASFLQPHQQQQVTLVKAEATSAVKSPGPSAEKKPPPTAAEKKAPPPPTAEKNAAASAEKTALVKAEGDEPKCILVKARSIDDIMGEKRQARKLEGSIHLGKKTARPNAAGATTEDHPPPPNKKPKALAFQKSRNIINKRINAETSKPEAAMVIDCSEVKVVQEKHSGISADWKALQEEVRSTSPKDEDALKELPIELHERWLSSRARHLGSKFDLHFAVLEHFLCHQHTKVV